jgi:hypothetical protein
MHRTKSGITKIKLLKLNTLYKLRRGTNPLLDLLYVIKRADSLDVYVKMLRVNGHAFLLKVSRDIFIGMWRDNTSAVNNAKEQTLAALRGLI